MVSFDAADPTIWDRSASRGRLNTTSQIVVVIARPAERQGHASAVIRLEYRTRHPAHYSRLRTNPPPATADAARCSARQTGSLHDYRVLHRPDDGGRDEGREGRRRRRPDCLSTSDGDQGDQSRRPIQWDIHGDGYRREDSRPSTRSVPSELRRSRSVRPSIRSSLDRAVRSQGRRADSLRRLPWNRPGESPGIAAPARDSVLHFAARPARRGLRPSTS